MRTFPSSKPRPLTSSLARLSSAAAVCAVLAMASSAPAANLQWDPDTAGAGASGGTGLWNTTSPFWFNGATNVNWSNAANDTAIFGGLPGIVSLDQPITAGGLTFAVDGYTIDNGLNLLNTLTLAGPAPAITVTTAGHIAQISAELAGAAGFTKAGAGTLALTSSFNSFSGPLNIVGGRLSYTNDQQFGTSLAINLSNGSSLSYLNTGETILGTGRVIDIGTGGGTIHSTAALRLFEAGQLTGSGTLTRTGDDTVYGLDIRGDNSGFTGKVVIDSGTLELQNVRALGDGTAPGQTITVNGGYLSTTVATPQKVILNGGTIGFNNNSTSSYSGGVEVQAASQVNLTDFYNATTGRSGSFTGPLTGSGTLTVNSPANTQVLVLRGNATGFTGGYTLTTNAVLSGSTGVAGGTGTLGGNDVTLNGGILRITPSIGSGSFGGQAGLLGSYYSQGVAVHNNNTTGVNYTIPTATRVDDDLNFRFLSVTGNVGTLEGVPAGTGTVNGGNVEQFAAMWKGLLKVTTGGQYTFVSSSDDASVVFIDGVQVLSNQGGHDFPGGGARGSTVTLSPGEHSLTVQLTQGTGGGGIVFAYEGPDQPILLQNPFPKDGYNTATLVPASVLSNAVVAGSVANKLIIGAGMIGGLEASGLDLSSSGIITIGALGTLNLGSPTAHSVNQTGAVQIAGDVTLGTRTAELSTTANSTISGIISGAGGITKNGLGTLTLTGDNSFTGTITISEGALAGNTTSLKRNIIIDPAATVVFNQATDGTYASNISGGGTVVKQSGGILTFTQQVGSGVTANAGTVRLNAGAAGPVTVNTGATLRSDANIVGTLAVNGGTLTVPAAPTTLSADGVSFGRGSTVNLALPGTPAAFALLTSTTDLTVTGATTVNLNTAGPVAAGTYRLFDYTGTPLPGSQFANLDLGTAPTGAFYSLLVNNTAATTVDFVLENFGALNTWTGTTSGVWDTTTATNWTAGAFANGQQVTFDDSGVNKTITGDAVAPQRITVSNSAGNDYTFANPITGTVAGGIQKNNAGSATFTGPVSVAGPINVTGGTLRLTNTSLVTPNNIGGTITVGANTLVDARFGGVRPAAPGESGSSSLGGAPLVLDGGNVVLNGARYDAGTGGLTGQFYAQQVNRNARVEFETLSGINALFNTSTPESLTGGFTNAITNIDFANTAFGNNAPFAALGLTNADNILALWRGQYVAPTDGTYTFLGRSDDALVVYIDGQLALNRNNFQGNSLTTSSINLTAGNHDILVGFYEGTGGAGVQLFETADGDVVDLADLQAAQPMTNLGNSVTLTANSTLRATNTFGVGMGSLAATTPHVTLTVGSLTGMDGMVRFSNTEFSQNGTYTFAANSDVALGSIADGANGLVMIAKTGMGNLILDNTVAIADTNGTTIRIDAGRLVAQRSSVGNNPLGTAKIVLNGVNTRAQFNIAEGATGNVSFDNGITVNEDARLEFMNHTTTSREILLGSAANGIAIAAGKTLEITATTNLNPRINSVISGNANLRFTMGADAGNTQGVVFLNAANTFTGKVTIESGGQVRLDNANALTSASAIEVRGNGRLEFFAANSFNLDMPRITSFSGSFFRVNNANAVNADFALGPGRAFEIQTASPLTGSGIITRAPNSYITVNNGTAPFSAATTQVGVRAQDLRSLDVVRVQTTIVGAGDDIIDVGWGSTAPGTIMQVAGGDRNLAGTNVQELNGQIITNDGTSRQLQDGNRLDVNVLGGTIAASVNTTLTLLEDLQTTENSGKITIGAHIPLDNRFSTGTVALANANFGDFTGTSASVAKAVDVIAGSVLEGRADIDGDTGFGSGTAPSLGVNLARGTLRSQQSVTNQATAGVYSATVASVFATGAGTLAANRNSTNAVATTELRLDSPIVRSPGATVSLFSQNNALGASERIKFVTTAEAPARLALTGTAPGNMVSPYLLNASGNIGSFVDYDPAQDPATGPGFVNTTYITPLDETALVPGAIVDITAPIALTADRTVAAARVSSALTGAFTLTSQSGGFILTNATNVNQSIAANLAAPAGTEFLFFSGGGTGGLHTLSGSITSDSGFTKFGLRTLVLGADNTTSLFGDIRINEASLVISNNNQLGALSNRVVLNGGNLRVNQDQTIDRSILVNLGGGQLANDANRLLSYTGQITGEGALTILSVNGNLGTTRFTGANPNTFAGGLIINGGTLEFSRNDQLGALPTPGDYDRGHVVVNEAGATSAGLRLAAGSGAVSAGDRQFTLLGGVARIEVVDAADSLTIANDIRGSGGLVKAGAGALILTNSDGNGYTGNTAVNAGALLANNSSFTGTGAGTVTVATGALLGGSGIIEGAITGTTGSTLSPGASLAAGSSGELRGQNGLTLNQDATFLWSLQQETTTGAGTNFDRFTLDNGLLTVNAGANFGFDFAPGAAPSSDAFWMSNQIWSNVIQLTSLATAGTLGAFDIDNAAWAAFGSFSAVSDADGYDLRWTAVPEPTTGLTLLAGLSSLLGLRRFRRRG